MIEIMNCAPYPPVDFHAVVAADSAAVSFGVARLVGDEWRLHAAEMEARLGRILVLDPSAASLKVCGFVVDP
ncbi:MAG: hypothetical protein AAF368_05815, partial [Planctomycetota bacterium]